MILNPLIFALFSFDPWSYDLWVINCLIFELLIFDPIVFDSWSLILNPWWYDFWIINLLMFELLIYDPWFYDLWIINPLILDPPILNKGSTILIWNWYFDLQVDHHSLMNHWIQDQKIADLKVITTYIWYSWQLNELNWNGQPYHVPISVLITVLSTVSNHWWVIQYLLKLSYSVLNCIPGNSSESADQYKTD